MSNQSLQPKIILGVAAHPDDLDFYMGGSVAQWVRQGAKAYYVILTNGDKGTHDRSLTPEELRKLRYKEQKAAAKVLGVKEVIFCDYEDGELENNLDVKKCIVRHIRHLKPDVVLTLDPTMVYSVQNGIINHPDHRAAGQACLDAVYPLARDHLAFPELAKEGLEPHEATNILLVNSDKGNFFVDISNVFETKQKAVAAHESQMSQKMLDLVEQMAIKTGLDAGYNYAENFVRIDIV